MNRAGNAPSYGAAGMRSKVRLVSKSKTLDAVKPSCRVFGGLGLTASVDQV